MDKPVKPLGRKAYGSIGHIHGSRLGPGDHTVNAGQSNICTTDAKDKVVWVQTKLDGSCCSVARLADGQLVSLGRAGYLASSSIYEMHQLFADYIRKREHWFEFLEPGERVVGEWLAQAHGTIYDLDGREPFVAFDIMTDADRVPLDIFLERLDSRIPCPDYMVGPIEPREALRLLNSYGAQEPEGVVYRVESTKRKGDPLQVDFLAKWVHEGKIDGKYFGDNLHWNWRP